MNRKLFFIVLLITSIVINGCAASAIEVTLPASLVEGGDVEGMMADAMKDDVSEVTVNDDGTITYKIPTSVHNGMMEEMGDSILESIDDAIVEFESVKEITHNKSFSEFTFSVKQEEYENSFDGFSILGVGILGMYYQVLDGADPENYKVTINLKNVDNEEVFKTIVYPDALEDI